MDFSLHATPRFALRLLYGIAIASFTCAGNVAWAQGAPASSGVPVVVGKAAKQNVPIWLSGLGTVQANYSVQLRPLVDGTLTQVAVKEGQDVKTGDLLAVIDPRPYQATLDSVLAKRQQDQAQLANAQADLGRYASLARQDFASRQQLDTQAAMVRQLTASIAGDDAQVEAAKLNLSFCHILAPFDARVGLRNIDPGNVVHSSEQVPIISVTQVQPISVTFTLPQDNLPAITKAMEGRTLDVVVYAPDGKTELDHGTLLTPDSSIDITTGTIKLKASFPNARHTLWPGQFVNARLLLGVDNDVIGVSAAAVQHGPNGLYVYKVTPAGTVAVQPIKVARQEGNTYVVSEGLTDGTEVVTDGQSRLEAGVHVAVRELQQTTTGSAKSGT